MVLAYSSRLSLESLSALFAQEDELTDLGHLVHGLIREGVEVAAAAGVSLHDDPWEMNVLAVQRGETGAGGYAHVPSMLEDVRARRATEVDFITGALVRESIRLGVPAPLNGVSQIVVSPEPDGGSDVPTHRAVIVARLS